MTTRSSQISQPVQILGVRTQIDNKQLKALEELSQASVTGSDANSASSKIELRYPDLYLAYFGIVYSFAWFYI
jgi:hypothetical protein